MLSCGLLDDLIDVAMQFTVWSRGDLVNVGDVGPYLWGLFALKVWNSPVCYDSGAAEVN